MKWSSPAITYFAEKHAFSPAKTLRHRTINQTKPNQSPALNHKPAQPPIPPPPATLPLPHSQPHPPLRPLTPRTSLSLKILNPQLPATSRLPSPTHRRLHSPHSQPPSRQTFRKFPSFEAQRTKSS